MKLLFDIETNGLPRQGLDHIHCVVVKDIDTEEVFRFNDTGNSDSITNAITFLQEADVLIGHNIVGFDIPVIQGIYPFFNPKATLFDTLILSRMFFPDILYSGTSAKSPLECPQNYTVDIPLNLGVIVLVITKVSSVSHTDWAALVNGDGGLL
jgi:DNA polymerase I